MPRNPYADLPSEAFWRSGVAAVDGPVSERIYTRKWPIPRRTKIATAGSCFAQHIGRQLQQAGFGLLDVERAPALLPAARRMDYGYGIYSARYGNIYTVRQMLQLAREAFGEIPQRNIVWEKDGRFYDGLRPTIEPAGLADAQTVIAHRRWHLEQVRKLLVEMDLLIFTLGLTEAWVDTRDGTVFPLCPGTVTDDFDPEHHRFHNFGFVEIHEDFLALRTLLNAQRPPDRPLRFLLTVSPVPLTATAAGQHVQVATVYSKSVLRAVAGSLADAHEDIDYFPSYEIVTSPWSGQRFYSENQRSVTAEGVACVMERFMASHGQRPASPTVPPAPSERPAPATVPTAQEEEAMLVKCDEELLDAFGKGPAA